MAHYELLYNHTWLKPVKGDDTHIELISKNRIFHFVAKSDKVAINKTREFLGTSISNTGIKLIKIIQF